MSGNMVTALRAGYLYRDYGTDCHVVMKRAFTGTWRCAQWSWVWCIYKVCCSI